MARVAALEPDRDLAVERQLEALFREIGWIEGDLTELGEAGTDKAHILMCQIFIKDLADFAAMNEVWEDWLAPGDAPPRATVQAQLARPQWKVEMVVTAAV